ncbi:uncharacterized protein PGTG_02111 [Puccinia graminis f. sp. tritici CRL 75-36-700-3]|uniref:NEDD8-activating enzyme E1 regulatory subunit n=1 Tax=Puccinia graminis f. sp. tritici (strain CRL 75-36-700-3 / race SCCL) TaxID=418459 RepID=E3JX75_PUCGT|nr:uncharacterized protein PGTG_02111 [Puccinia graminis f. sp. tritici CRL 75-36-700-3]EFP76650.2 hypothetical protein PGTG_02111 [Puccinia graminis f. sp. tritici CRL 75-36-700-3]
MKREADEDGPGSLESERMSNLAEKVVKTVQAREDGDQKPAFLNPASSARPDRTTQIFDRQLRLWEIAGQKRLEKGAVKICDCSATSAQIAKNLVLAGVNHLDMYDDKLVRQSDIGNHFFLDQASLGRNRSKECCRLLKESSPSKSIVMYNDELLNEEYFDGFDDFTGFWTWDAHIAVRLIDDDEDIISHHCWDFNVPTILVQTCGLAASIRVQIREHSVIQTNPDSLADLRLDSPFPSLSEFVNSFEMDKLDNHEHAHIPAVVIVIHFLEIFKSKHDGNLPQDAAQREELKQMILAEKRNADEDNFDEAVGMIWRACQPTKVPEHVEELFKNPHCDKIPWWDGRFWRLVKSLRKFVKQNPSRQLPLSGVLPDMKSDTKNYVKLQSIYRQQAMNDLETFKKIMNGTDESTEEKSEEEKEGEEGQEKDRGKKEKKKVKKEEDDEDDEEDEDEDEEDEEDEGDEDEDEDGQYRTDAGHYTEGPDLDVSSEMLETFVKNSAHIRLVRGRSSGTQPKDLIAKIEKEFEPGNEDYTATWYLAFEVMSSFRSLNKGEYPGMRKGQEEEDFNSLSEIALNCLRTPPSDDKEEEKVPEKLPEKLEKVLKEMVRSAGCELPHISSIVGGLVSQEVIKLITGQYIPMNGVCIFDGYKSTTRVLEF